MISYQEIIQEKSYMHNLEDLPMAILFLLPKTVKNPILSKVN